MVQQLFYQIKVKMLIGISTFFANCSNIDGPKYDILMVHILTKIIIEQPKFINYSPPSKLEAKPSRYRQNLHIILMFSIAYSDVFHLYISLLLNSLTIHNYS